MTAADLPPPMVPPECDISSLPGTIMFWNRLLNSDLWMDSTGDEFKAALALWGKSTNQQPGGSLPNDDRRLAKLAEVSHNEWAALRPMSLKGWVLCSDGRLYHESVAEAVLLAWIGRLGSIKRSAAGNDAKSNRKFDPTPHDEARARAEEFLQRLPKRAKTRPSGKENGPLRETQREPEPDGGDAAPSGDAGADGGPSSLREPDPILKGEESGPSGKPCLRSQVEVEVEAEGKKENEGSNDPSCAGGRELVLVADAGPADDWKAGFARFWEAYPKKVGKTGPGGAEGAFKSAAKGTGWPGVDEVIADVQWRTANSWDERRYIPNPATYLNQSRWLDERVVRSRANGAATGSKGWSGLGQAIAGLDFDDHEGAFE